MNHIVIIGNLVRDPESRTIPSGTTVCNFTVAVNRRRGGTQQEVDYFRVSAWGATGENCQKFLVKGNKVAVSGTVSANAYMANDGTPRASLEISTVDVEFLTPKSNSTQTNKTESNQDSYDDNSGFVEVNETELPF